MGRFREDIFCYKFLMQNLIIKKFLFKALQKREDHT